VAEDRGQTFPNRGTYNSQSSILSGGRVNMWHHKVTSEGWAERSEIIRAGLLGSSGAIEIKLLMTERNILFCARCHF